MPDQRIPITLLTGFLGAGKTTLLNAVLNDNSAGQIALQNYRSRRHLIRLFFLLQGTLLIE